MTTNPTQMAYFDCFSGASGDMFLAALLHAGADLGQLRQELGTLGVPFELTAEMVNKQGFAAIQVRVADRSDAPAHHRSLSTIEALIGRASLAPRAKERALTAFRRLGQAEAKVHNCPVDRVHFHEVGAVDAIVDIVGTMLALEQLGVQRVICAPVPTGSGTVRCAHGDLPIPAPATAELLRGVPLAHCDEVGELTTPTGAAIITALAESYGALPEMTLAAIGYGAGQRDGQNRPNVLRVLLGLAASGTASGTASPGETDQVVELTTQLDDASGQVIGYCQQRLLNAGALDVYCVPITMKKSRPGVLLTVLARPEDVIQCEAILFTETPTLGIRRQWLQRSKLSRRIEQVETPFGPVRIKVAFDRGQVLTATPEYDDCQAAAERCQVALRTVIEAAKEVWANRPPT